MPFERFMQHFSELLLWKGIPQKPCMTWDVVVTYQPAGSFLDTQKRVAACRQFNSFKKDKQCFDEWPLELPIGLDLMTSTFHNYIRWPKCAFFFWSFEIPINALEIPIRHSWGPGNRPCPPKLSPSHSVFLLEFQPGLMSPLDLACFSNSPKTYSLQSL